MPKLTWQGAGGVGALAGVSLLAPPALRPWLALLLAPALVTVTYLAVLRADPAPGRPTRAGLRVGGRLLPVVAGGGLLAMGLTGGIVIEPGQSPAQLLARGGLLLILYLVVLALGVLPCAFLGGWLAGRRLRR